MSEQNWVVTINPGSPNASFDPDVYGTPPGSPLKAQLGDLVCWNNQTNDSHEIWVTNEQYQPQTQITEKIAKYKSSSPGYVTALKDVSPPTTKTPPPAVTIYYYCSEHTGEHGQISIG